MASDFETLGSAIYSAVGGAGTADGLNLYYALAPQGSVPPYAIFQRIEAIDDYTFNTRNVSVDYLLKVVSNRRWPGEAQRHYGTFEAAMQNAALNVSGYTLLRCRRTATVEFQDGEGFWHVGGIFRIDAEKT